MSSTMTSETAFVYQMRWFDADQGLDCITFKYFMTEGETRWCHDWPTSRYSEVVVVELNKSSDEYKEVSTRSKLSEEEQEMFRKWGECKETEAFIYEMRWFTDRESLDCNTSMCYLTEEETRWGHDWTPGCNGSEYCKVVVMKVSKSSGKYESAFTRPTKE